MVFQVAYLFKRSPNGVLGWTFPQLFQAMERLEDLMKLDG